MAREARRSLLAVCVVRRPNLVLSMNVRRSSTFCFREGSSMFFSLYGSADWLPVDVLLKEDMLGRLWVVNCWSSVQVESRCLICVESRDVLAATFVVKHSIYLKRHDIRAITAKNCINILTKGRNNSLVGGLAML